MAKATKAVVRSRATRKTAKATSLTIDDLKAIVALDVERDALGYASHHVEPAKPRKGAFGSRWSSKNGQRAVREAIYAARDGKKAELDKLAGDVVERLCGSAHGRNCHLNKNRPPLSDMDLATLAMLVWLMAGDGSARHLLSVELLRRVGVRFDTDFRVVFLK